MKIRSITSFVNPGFPPDRKVMEQAARFLEAARPAFVAVGYEVQTARLASVPFPELLASAGPGGLPELAQALEAQATSSGYDYVCLGPAHPGRLECYQPIPEAIAATQSAFFAGIMAAPGIGVSLPAIRACAQVIHHSAGIDPNGFANLRFAALANVPPGAPFFPAAYHQGNAPAFALAMEAAGLAVEAVSAARSLESARQNLQSALERHGRNLAGVAGSLAARFPFTFGGIDFSLAPFPETARSLGTALERLGSPEVGRHGSLAAAAFLADTLDRARFPRAGFNGLFLPVLEDATLAARAAGGSLSIKDLLLFSAVCGTGLDTLPLPGDLLPAQIEAILLDVAVLSERLKKPLTARLLPIPGKTAGEPTHFDFEYFANSRVLDVQSAPLGGLLAGDEAFSLEKRG